MLYLTLESQKRNFKGYKASTTHAASLTIFRDFNGWSKEQLNKTNHFHVFHVSELQELLLSTLSVTQNISYRILCQ